MLERVDRAGGSLRPADLLDALRERTKELHAQAERSGTVADILHGRATRADYVLMLRNLLPVYRELEQKLSDRSGSSALGGVVRIELERATAIVHDLDHLFADWPNLAVLPAAQEYVAAIQAASDGDGTRLIAHAYARYLGDLSGGQILKRLLERSLGLSPAALSFFDFPTIVDIPAFKAEYRAAISRAGDEVNDLAAVVEEGARAFELNITLSMALQAAKATG
ncbi:heme oxygenase (biliverdin-producing) [Bradyrhizobium jicamae]|uniref:biliverdin-producing heme oxygenase n=1 Tax=Bradyrhizobium jicamae TaxID=280332 RepID=UPI001BA985F8|nr:biliverdin-producing heme oxygenase [Bradyrhizobium jicamae]MBR0934181.1 biliverdin-producing heme oxygenase [Bradyrhizobium jicamae]